ncbi:MAG TPA: hypothetical protein VNB94_10375 [Mycobacteriales bacterium]|nr:hypothetical protein [Mycobacteriales bacterium]
MKRIVILGIAAGLCATGVSAQAAPKAPKAPKPIPMTYFMHGTQAFGEVESNIATGTFMTLDQQAPTGSSAKSKQVANYVGGPNTNCAGNSLFPTFVGELAGDVTGDMTVTFTAWAGPATQLNLQVFQDVEAQSCNADFPKVAGALVVDVPAGQGKVTAVIKNVKLKSKRTFMLHFAPLPTSAGQARVFYDSTTDNSSVAFSCLPRAPKKTC